MRLILRKVGTGLAAGDFILTAQDDGGEADYTSYLAGDCEPILVDWRNRVPQLLLSTTEYRLYPFWQAARLPPCRVCVQASAGSIVHEVDLVTIYEVGNTGTAWEPLEIRCRVDGGAWSIWSALSTGTLQALLDSIGAHAEVRREILDTEVVWSGNKSWYAAAVRFAGQHPRVLEVEARKASCICILDFAAMWDLQGEPNAGFAYLRSCLEGIGFQVEVGIDCYAESAAFDRTLLLCDDGSQSVTIRVLNNPGSDQCLIEVHGNGNNTASISFLGPALALNGHGTLTRQGSNSLFQATAGVDLICGTTTTLHTEVQRLQLGGGPTNDEFQWVRSDGGDYTLTLDGAESDLITDASEILTALEGITAAGDVTLHGLSPTGLDYLVEFQNGRGNTNLPEMTGSAGVIVTRVSNGGPVP